MPREHRRLREATSDLVRTLVDTKILTKEQAKDIEALLFAGKHEKAGKLLGRYLDGKEKDGSSKD